MEAKLYPASYARSITPHDTNVLTSDGTKPVRCRGISVAVAGDIAFKDPEGTVRIAANLAAGVIHPISTNHIMATGTAATGICIFW